MAWAHLIFGILVFVVFLVTGRFMRADFPDKEIIPPEFRLLMRSRHIYIMLSSLAHILLGLYLQIHAETWRKILQTLGSLLLISGSILLIWAFWQETYVTHGFSNLSRYGLYATLYGTIFHLLANLRIKTKT
jgi:uncharacterized membrane protein